MPSSTNKLQWCRLHFVDGIGISNFDERPTRFSPDFNWNLHRSCLLATGDIAIKHQLRFDAISFVCVHKTTEKFISVVYLSFVVRCIYCWWNDGDIFSISSRLVFGFTTATVRMRVRVYNVLSRRSNLRMRVAQMSRTMLSYLWCESIFELSHSMFRCAHSAITFIRILWHNCLVLFETPLNRKETNIQWWNSIKHVRKTTTSNRQYHHQYIRSDSFLD